MGIYKLFSGATPGESCCATLARSQEKRALAFTLTSFHGEYHTYQQPLAAYQGGTEQPSVWAGSFLCEQQHFLMDAHSASCIQPLPHVPVPPCAQAP